MKKFAGLSTFQLMFILCHKSFYLCNRNEEVVSLFALMNAPIRKPLFLIASTKRTSFYLPCEASFSASLQTFWYLFLKYFWHFFFFVGLKDNTFVTMWLLWKLHSTKNHIIHIYFISVTASLDRWTNSLWSISSRNDLQRAETQLVYL